jgi:hypothetical protein
MADKKSARRPSREDDEAPAPKKKSGTQKSVKKPSSANKKAMDPDDDDDDSGSGSKKRGSSREKGGSASARQAGPDKGKIFLYFVPGVILVLLGLGYYVATLPEPKGPEKVEINFDAKVAEAKTKYVQAKAAYQAGSGQEGAAGVPKLKEAKSLLEEAQKIIQGVRDGMDEMEKKAKEDTSGNTKLEGNQSDSDPKGATYHSFQFDEDETQINQLLVMCRKAILERE